MPILRALRYLDGRNSALAAFVRDRLHALDYPEAMRFYREIEPTLRPIDKAFLGCNDRFFLMVGLLGRVDMVRAEKAHWLYERVREVEAEPDDYLDLWSRYHFKTSIITTAGTIQEVLGDPEMTVAIFSHNKSSANKLIGQIKYYFERSRELLEIFPDVLWEHPKRDAPRWSETGITLRRRGNPKEATVEGFGLIDGMPTGGHWKMLVYDDIVTERVTNPEMVRKATEQWELSTNLGVGEGTKVRMAGTRYSYNDPYTIVLKRGIRERRYPATDNGKLDGNPVLYSKMWWEDVKQKQRSTVAAQMLQNPLAGSENTFKPEWLTPWEIRPSHLNVYIMCDPNKGHSRRSDRTGIAVVGVDGAGMKYLLDGYRHRMSLEERWVAVRDLHAKWSRQPGVGICEVGYERYGALTDEEYFKTAMREGRHQFSLKILNWVSTGGQSKKDRVERLEPDFRRGRFRLPGVVFDPGLNGPALWRFDPAQNKIIERQMTNPTSEMKRVIAAGGSHLCAKPIVRKDEDGKLYDVTLALIDEMLLFPFAPKDDLVDAVSRIYDMDPVTPSLYEDREVERLSRELEEA